MRQSADRKVGATGQNADHSGSPVEEGDVVFASWRWMNPQTVESAR